MMNYHALTMDEPRDSPARRKQYLVICTIMAAVFFHAFLTSGGLLSVAVKEGIFPGGEFVHRFTERDYAAVAGLMEEVGNDADLQLKNYTDLMYTLYLDDPWVSRSGPSQRFAIGLLLDKAGAPLKKKLLEANKRIRSDPPKSASDEVTNLEAWDLTEYQVGDLPSVDAAVVQFPHTGGFVSALVTSYKVIPAIRKYAKEKGEAGNVPVVISTCSYRHSMCTHYAPLVQGKDFLLGRPESEAFLASLSSTSMVNWEGVVRDFKWIFPPARWLLD